MKTVKQNIESYKIDQLKENYIAADSSESFLEYIKCESESDPRFFSWLFDDENLPDFAYSDLSDSQRAAWDEYIANA